MSAGQIMVGAGCITWWGFGPARDLFNTGVPKPQGELNVLLVGSGDPRHVLKTIAGLSDTDKLHVWVLENSMEVVARQLLLLYVSLISPDSMGLQEKTEVFLELFGNSEIRHQTEETLKDMAAGLLRSVTDALSTDCHTHPCLDTCLLKFKERDELVQIFKLWQHPPTTSNTMGKLWDARVRQHLGARYDARWGCFDWDLHMKLHDKGCSIIQKQQYVKWRETGVAFEMREGLYEIANQSLLSTRVFSRRGDRVGLRGYWGDIVSSPYLSFGIETENKELLKMQNNQHVKTAQDVAIANLHVLFERLSTRGRHQSNLQSDNEAESTIDILTTKKTQESEEKLHCDVSQMQTSKSNTQEEKLAETSNQKDGGRYLELINLSGVNVSFLPLDSLPKLTNKSRYSQLFNIIYCSASMVHHLDQSLKQVAAPDAVLMVELGKYLLDLSKEQEASFVVRVGEIAKEAGFVPAYDHDNDAYAVFTLQQE